LFEKNTSQLQTQRSARELEVIVQECILVAIRDSIPTEAIIRAYMDESVEHEEEVTIENIEDPVQPTKVEENVSSETPFLRPEENIPSTVPAIENIDTQEVTTRLTFNDVDSVLTTNNIVKSEQAPKTLERLEEISTSRALERKLEEIDSSDDEDDRIKISSDLIDLSGFDILDEPNKSVTNDFLLNDVEVLG
jgi:hypothetical protein